ncbi:MAG: hypothetical protein WB780_20320 [Candidatus Acidiferrales bacterium]
MRKWSVPILILAVWLAIAFGLSLWQPELHVQAQGQTQSFTFTVPASSQVTIKPIPNFNQTGHTLSYAYVNATGGLPCSIWLQISYNGVNFFTLGAVQGFTGSSGLSSANGYFPLYQLKFSACVSSDVTAVYSGYGAIVPIPTLSHSIPNLTVGGGAVQATFYYPAIMVGLQCTNYGAADYWLQVIANPTRPTVGSTAPVYQVQVPQNATFGYFGPPIAVYEQASGTTGGGTTNLLWLGASATPGGVGVGATPFICNVQNNPFGPFYPLLPSGP